MVFPVVTPVFLPGESQGRGSLVGCRLWGHTESDTTEVISSSSKITGHSARKRRGKPFHRAAPHLTALMAQNNFSRPQGQIHGSWWDIAKVIATSLKEGGEIDTALANYQASMEALFTMSDEVLKAWTVIGNLPTSNWTDDLPMTEQADGTWKSNEAYEMTTSSEFKVRQGKSWDNNYGVKDDGTPDFNGANGNLAKLGKEAGKYFVVLDPATGAISLIAA